MALSEERHAGAPPATWLVIACLAAIYIVWGTTYYALKVGVHGAAPFWLVGTRFLAAGAILMAWLMMRGAPLPTLKQWGGSAVVGFLMLTVGLGSVATAEQWVSSGAAVALISAMPLATALWSGAFGKWPRVWEWLAILLGVAGTLVMIMGGDLQGSPRGTALVILGLVSWALGTILSRRIELPAGAMGFAAEMLAGGVLTLMVSAALGESWTVPSSATVWYAWLYLVILGSLVAFSAYRFVVERVSPTLAATYAYVNPPVALFVGWWLGNESFSPNVLIGLPIVLAAVAMHTWMQLRFTRGSAAVQGNGDETRGVVGAVRTVE